MTINARIDICVRLRQHIEQLEQEYQHHRDRLAEQLLRSGLVSKHATIIEHPATTVRAHKRSAYTTLRISR